MEAMSQSAGYHGNALVSYAAGRCSPRVLIQDGENLVSIRRNACKGSRVWSVAAVKERAVVSPERSGGTLALRRRRFEGLQYSRILSTLKRNTIVEEGSKLIPVTICGCHALFWENVVQHFYPLWCAGDRLSHEGNQIQFGVDKNILRSDIASKLFQVSLISFLCVATPWFEPASSLARAETLNTSGQAQCWQNDNQNALWSFYSKEDSKVGVKTSLQKASLQGDVYETSLNTVTSVAGRPGNFGPGIMSVLAEGTKVCQETYGFLPCSDSLGGNLSLIVGYGYFLLLAAQLISNGTELLLEVMNPGLLGGLLLPILGALPDALLIVVSGVGGNAQEAQEQVMVGIGVLAGSIVMLLTIGWAGSLYTGRCDLSGPGGTAKDRMLTRSLDWKGTGVTTDEQTRVGAWIMVISTLPFVVVQIPLLDGHPAEGPEAALIGSIIAALGVFAYCFYQVAYPWLQQKRIVEARLQFLRSRALQRVTAFSGKRAPPAPIRLQENLFGPSRGPLKELFASFDSNKDGKIEKEELKGLLVGLELEEEGSIPDSLQLDLWLQDFDTDFDGTLSEHEFVTGIAKWAHRISQEKSSRKIQLLENSLLGADDPNFWAMQSSEAKKVLDLLESEADSEETEGEEKEVPLETSSLKRNAALYLAGGAALAAMFAEPLVDAIGGFSNASGIPPFFVAFVVTPFASNASELFSSIIFARGRRKKNISLTFSQLYGGVTMNNTLCLGLFLGVVYVRGLRWDFSSEVTVILLSVLAMGAIGGSRTTFPLWLTLPVLAIYPLCISLVVVLDNFLGWH